MTLKKLKMLLPKVKHFLFLLCFIINSAHLLGQNFFMPESITYNKLENGFSYYLLPEDSKRGTITLHLVSTVGSLVETPEQRGIAHFIEHMVFKGSKNYPGTKTMESLDLMGLRIGRDYNASVNSTKTEYHITLPADNWEYLKQTLSLLKDWINNLEMEETSFKVEQKVVIEEIKKRNGSVSPYLNGTMLEGHEGLGTEAQINSITAKQVKDFYQKYYTPDSFALFIQGVVNTPKVAQYINTLFGAIPKSTTHRTSQYIDLTQATVIDTTYTSNLKQAKPTLILAFKTPSFAINNKASFRENFLQFLFTEMLENRLKAFPDQSLSLTTVNRGEILPGSTMYNFRLQGNDSTPYKRMLINFGEVIAQARTFGFTQEEIDFFTDKFIKRTKNNSQGDAIGFRQAENHFLTGDTPLTTTDKIQLLEDLRKTITPSDFISLLNSFTKYHKTILLDNTSEAYSNDFSTRYILEQIQNINSKASTAKKHVFKKPSDGFASRRKTNLPAIAVATKTPANIESKKILGEGLYLLTYANGVKVLVNNSTSVKPKIKLLSNQNTSFLPEEERSIFNASLKQFNTYFGDFSEEASKKLLRKYLFAVNSKIDDQFFELELRCNNPAYTFENLLKVFNLIISEEKQPNTEAFIKKLGKSRALDSLDTSILNEKMVKQFFNYNEQIKHDFNHAYIYVGGNLPENIDTLISSYIGTLKPLESSISLQNGLINSDIAPASYTEKNRGKVQKLANFTFQTQYNNSFSLNEELIAEVVAEYSYYQIFEILRKKHGLVYASGSSAEGDKNNKTTSVSLRYIADSSNLTNCKGIMINEILLPMHIGEISKNHLKISKAKLASKYALSFYDDDVLSDTYLKLGLKYGRLYTAEELIQKINAIHLNKLKNSFKTIITIQDL